MSKRIVIVVGLVVVVVAALYGALRDQLPPRTAAKVARVVSGLDVPAGAEVLVFEDEWNSFNGDGSTLIVLQLPTSALDQFVSEAEEAGFRSATTNDGLPDRVASQLRATTPRLVRVEGDVANGKTVVVDPQAGRLIVYQVVS